MAEAAAPAGLQVAVVVLPRSHCDEVLSSQGGALKIRLRAPAVEGAANAACVAFLAELFGLRRPQVKLLRGHRSRHKVVVLYGDPTRLAQRLAELLGDLPHGRAAARS